MIPVIDFKKEVTNWADDIGVVPKQIHVREMRKKWASCSSKGRLTFSYDLLDKNYEKRSIAIVHELLHLKYPSHNKMFNNTLKAYLEKNGLNFTVIE